MRQVKSLAEENKIPLFLDASRVLENSYFVQEREPGCRALSIAEIARETFSLCDGCTMSAIKDFLAPIGGFIGMRDEKSYQQAYFQSFLDGAQPPATALASLDVSLSEIFGSPLYVASRVEQVGELWRRLKGVVPVLSPPGGHGIFIDARSFLPRLPLEHHPAEALAAFIFAISGVRVTKGPPLTQSQIERGMDLLRLAVPARRYLPGHMEDVVKAVLMAYSRREEIRGLKTIAVAGRSRYDPPLFEPIDS